MLANRFVVFGASEAAGVSAGPAAAVLLSVELALLLNLVLGCPEEVEAWGMASIARAPAHGQGAVGHLRNSLS